MLKVHVLRKDELDCSHGYMVGALYSHLTHDAQGDPCGETVRRVKHKLFTL